MAITERNGRKWVSVAQAAQAVPDPNAHLSALSRQQMDWAHRKGVRFLDTHYEESGAKCSKCFPPRKTRPI